MTRVAALTFAAFLSLTLLLPLAAADHAYSHRNIIYGRVVDANGDPVPNLTVDLGTSDFHPEGPCSSAQPGIATDAFGDTVTHPVTNEYGEFIFCYHVHEMSRALPGSAQVAIREVNYTTSITFDPYFREQFVAIQLPEANANANKEILSQNFTVQGRIWQSSSTETILEQIRVFGLAMAHTPLTVTVNFDDGTTQTKNTTSNNYGDFSLRFPVTKRPTGGSVTLEVNGHKDTRPVDAKMGVTSFKTTVPKPLDPFVKNLLIGGGIVVGLGVVGGFGWYGVRKMSAKRDADEARARSTRKRANR